jgi:4-nitrophenyl phosphatase
LMNREDQDLGKLSSIESLIIDMDGVLYRGRERLPGARAFLAYLVEQEVPFILGTNNSTLTPQEYVTKLAAMDIGISPERILTSGQASALYLAKVASPGARVYAIGEDGLFAALKEQGFRLTDEDVRYVVVGMDRKLTWDKLRIATLAIRAGATFIGTNPDTTLPTEEGLVPGNGANLAALEVATEVTPLIIGKPQPTLLELAMEKMGVGKKGTAMVGDRLETDILGGKNAGLTTVLVLSGITQPEELEGSPYRPDLVFQDIGHFHQAWRDRRLP